MAILVTIVAAGSIAEASYIACSVFFVRTINSELFATGPVQFS